jgi:predicted RNA binding protein YcfA (HicA-like mRNA interferase family)
MASLTYRELRRLLLQYGCQYKRTRGGHEIWVSREGRPFSVPVNLKGEGTLRKILKDAGIERDPRPS